MPVDRTRLRQSATALVALLTSPFISTTALAAPLGGGGGMPWESSFSKILDSIQSTAPILATVAFIFAGLVWMFGESGGMSRRVVGVDVGGSVVFGAAPLITTLFEGSAGLLF